MRRGIRGCASAVDSRWIRVVTVRVSCGSDQCSVVQVFCVAAQVKGAASERLVSDVAGGRRLYGWTRARVV